MNTASNPPVDATAGTSAAAGAAQLSGQAAAQPTPAAPPWSADTHLPTALLLNIGHAFDHMFLLIFATAVATIAADFGVERWESLMPYTVGAFFLFGIGSLPSGRLGDLWGRRAMMSIFFSGMGCPSLITSLAGGPWQ